MTATAKRPSTRLAYVVSERYVQQRLIPMAMEPRAVVALPQPFGGDMTLVLRHAGAPHLEGDDGADARNS